MNNELFYAQGLDFSCKRCSACCRHESGYVFLSENDIEKLIIKFGLERNSFIGEYCRWVDDRKGRKALSLKERDNKDCIFWDSAEGCSVYIVRPIQCWMFPFWDTIVSSKENWELAASGCPGMNSGKHYSKEAIGSLIKLSRLEPIIYKGGE